MARISIQAGAIAILTNAVPLNDDHLRFLTDEIHHRLYQPNQPDNWRARCNSGSNGEGSDRASSHEGNREEGPEHSYIPGNDRGDNDRQYGAPFQGIRMFQENEWDPRESSGRNERPQ